MSQNLLTSCVETERALLGALMLDPRCAERIDVPLSPSSFYREDHGRIFAAIQALRTENRPHDSLSVFHALEGAGNAERCGGMAYVVELETAVLSAANAHRHAEIIHERALRRQALAAADEIAAAASDPQRDTREVLDFAQSKVMSLGEQAHQRFVPARFEQVAYRAVQRIQARYDADKPSGLSTGFTDLDARLSGGLRPGQLVIVAARPGMGKTSFALQVAMHAGQHDEPALVCSQEMVEEELANRALALDGRIDLGRVITGKLGDEDWHRMTAALGRLRDAKLWIDEQPALTLLDVRNKARRVVREAGRLSLLVVDYLQLMVGEGANRNAEIEQISRGLKQIAKELEMPVIALSQLSRECEKRPNKRPMASDLRDSGAIEQDADVILSLYRDEIYNPESLHKGMAELGVIKCRNGRAGGFVPLTFMGEFTRFESFAGQWAQDESKPARRGRLGADD